MRVRNRFFRLKTWFNDEPPADGSDDANGDAGGGSGGVEVEQFNQLVQTVGTLAQGLNALQESVQQLTQQQQPADDGGESASDFPEADDLETLPRADFAKYIVDLIDKRVTPKIQELDEKLKTVETGVQAVDTKTAIKEFAEKHPDFWEWKDELQAIMKEVPGITVERAYRLVRAENPAKAKQLDERLSEASGKKRQAFGGLTPTSGRAAKQTKLSPSEAAEAAWEQTMADLEAALSTEPV